jgi:hypothetical protein
METCVCQRFGGICPRLFCFVLLNHFLFFLMVSLSPSSLRPVHSHTHTHTRTHAHKRTSAQAHTHTRTHAHTHTHARTHTRTHAQTHARTHTHTRTHTQGCDVRRGAVSSVLVQRTRYASRSHFSLVGLFLGLFWCNCLGMLVGLYCS